jgi:hypothetical protein
MCNLPHSTSTKLTAVFMCGTPLITRSESFLVETGMQHDALAQLDIVLSVTLNRIKTQSLPSEMPGTVNLVDTSVFDMNCTKINSIMPTVFSAVQVESIKSSKSGVAPSVSRPVSGDNVTCAVKDCKKKAPDNVQRSVEYECRKQNISVADYVAKPGFKCLCHPCFLSCFCRRFIS